MVFTIVIGLLFLAIVFFHYLQGFFSSAISAVLAVLAAVLAFSWHETLVEKFLQGKAANVAHAMVLVALFAAIYLILRIIFDKAVPEGLHLPAAVDKAGAALMGIVAAVFTTGILSIAAQELPFGASVGGYTKYDTADTNAQLQPSGGGQLQTGYAFDNLHSPDAGHFDENDRRQMFPVVLAGVDEIVVDTVARLSETGSLQGSQPLNEVHPDFLQELFGQRIGIQGGAQHVAMNHEGQKEKSVELNGFFTVPQVRIVDGESPGVRGPAAVAAPVKIVKEAMVVTAIRNKTEIKEKVQYAAPGIDKDNSKELMFFVARISFGIDAADNQDIVRVSPGSIRLCAKKLDRSGALQPANYYPIGTLEPGAPHPLLYVDKPDDFILIPMKGLTAETRPGIDAVFAVDKDTFLTGDKDKKKIQEGAFIEVKRMFREEIGGKSLKPWSPPSAKVTLGSLHQVKIQPVIGSASTPAPGPAK